MDYGTSEGTREPDKPNNTPPPPNSCLPGLRFTIYSSHGRLPTRPRSGTLSGTAGDSTCNCVCVENIDSSGEKLSPTQRQVGVSSLKVGRNGTLQRLLVLCSDVRGIYRQQSLDVCILSSVKLNATGLRWVGELTEFKFEIKYRPDRVNIDADCLSRPPPDIQEFMESCSANISLDVVQAGLYAVKAQETGDVVWITAVSTDEKELQPDKGYNAMPAGAGQLKTVDVVKAQHEDSVISRVLQLLKTGHKPSVTEIGRETRQVRKYLCKWQQLNVSKKNGILYHKEQLVLSHKFKRMVYRELHEEMVHLGVERVLDLARQRFFWPNMRRDIEHFVHHVCRCLKQKQPNRSRGTITTYCHNGAFPIDFN